jgi:two-component system alkaline phosphatase synthesis response regulator PhoP
MPQKILIVDDDPIVTMLYRPHLVRAGYTVLTASNGREALKVAAKEFPRLIVMDVLMAEMDGLTALRELKKLDRIKHAPVILTSASVGTHDATRRESELAGAALFLPKPFSPAKLVEEVQRLLPVPQTNQTPTAPAK